MIGTRLRVFIPMHPSFGDRLGTVTSESEVCQLAMFGTDVRVPYYELCSRVTFTQTPLLFIRDTV
jgi:hypothetical protein